ncbi:MAG TPA: ATP-binding protein [Ideonella sp.]|uniref:hybrid sensor histidine kinase/response regulator n=1 Tax=Ideonella sp. TaxID=1929293 RepID=UPI002E34246C|nr:ATP-binding protein [Ideonella sp.]HEX5685713.1 ATP-binding protein [Ideonella sp.]
MPEWPLPDPQDNRYLFEANPLPLFIYDLATLQIMDANVAACSVYGYSRDEFCALTIRDIRPAEDVQYVEESVRRTPPTSRYSGVWRHLTKNQVLIYVEINSRELVHQGKPARLVCPVDVTQRVHAEAALREREAELNRAQGLAQLAHVVTSDVGWFENWSDTLHQLAGCARANLPRSLLEWAQLIHPDDRDTFLRTMSAGALPVGRVDVEYRLVQPSGAQIHVHQTIEPLASGAGDGRRHWFNTLQDVTSQKTVAANAQRLNEVLERRIHERTAELERSNDELTAAKAAAERANQAKSDFLSSMSHELRTPLNAVIGFGQLLATTGGRATNAEQHAGYVRHIVEAGQHLLLLINELLDLAQIEAGKVSIQLQAVRLSDLLEESLRMMSPMAAARSIRLDSPDDCELLALADRGRLKQAMINLLSNAIKYNRPHGTVSITCTRPRALRIRIEVRDTGAGLGPSQMASLFQPFNRLGQETGRTEGSGIGLVLTKRLVELMNGEIGASSTPGAGSMFWIEVPEAAASPAAKASDLREPAALAAPHPGRGDKQRIPVLCVDDHPASQMLVEEILRHRPQLKLLKADNGRLGVELARRHRPAVIFMDNNMPGMSGREAQRILRSDARTAHIPIIALTASATAGDVARGAADGFFRFLTKPIDVGQLLSAVDDALGTSTPSDPV